ncbi:YhcN/YlaJ family sporulation lipoprotein [Oceanobacillus massiliensis]|uniref:YhcN/YlaJ family sporulation lipoprotein n=1 Tax=Oceanobacillus massiliensis TaxID=1465765 RepID=UPI0002889C5C|nr:YhcN/YlaJ family sporulation lipoprotein [Oceanobacillus massiliensis]
MKFLYTLTLFLTAAIFLTGCATTNNTMNKNDQIADELDPARNSPEPTNQDMNSQLGYVRYTKDQFQNDDENNDKAISIDRNEMADMITRIILRSDGFEEVATLVTDQEVLIAYERSEATDEQKAADITKKTAMSIMPSYFDIYVSDNETLMQDIQSLHNSSSENRNYDNTINLIIKEMQKSSQGSQNQGNPVQ